MLRWYRLYLRQFRMANADAAPRVESRKIQTELPKLTLRELVTCVLALRDAAANHVRSREEFYVELKRLSAVSSLTMVTITSKGSNSIEVMKALREIAFANHTQSFDSSLRTAKDIVDQVVAGNPYTFKVRPQHRDVVVAKLCGAGAMVE